MLKPNLILDKSLLKVRNLELLKDAPTTYLSSPVSATGTELTVMNINSALVDGYIIIGQIGSEDCELKKIHASTAPTGATITLSSGVTYSHPTDTVIYFIGFNQIEFSRATTSGGDKSVLATVTITPDNEFTFYSDVTNTTGYAYARLKNSTTTTYSSYSTEQEYASMAFNSIGRIIDNVFNDANEKTEDFISREEVLFDYIYGFYNKVSELRTKWKHEEASSDTSNATTTGGETFSLPTDIKYPDQKGIQCISIEGYIPLEYMSVTDLRNKLAGKARSTLNGAVLLGATTVDLINGVYFADAGTGYIAGDEFTWTGKTDNQLTGVSGILAHDDGSTVYQSDAVGLPEKYTIQNGTGYIYPAPSSDYDGIPIVIDYYKDITRPTSENDIIAIPYIESCREYCRMRVEQKRKDFSAADRYESSSTSMIIQAIKNERTGQRGHISTRE